jgi:hypothetical protein
MPAMPPQPTHPTCQRCNAPLQPGNARCGNCGFDSLGSAPIGTSRNATPILVALGAIALAAIIVVGAFIMMAGGGNQTAAPLDGGPGAPVEACSLASTDGWSFVLVRGAGAQNDCQTLLADFAASTVQTWQVSSGQIPPSSASNLYCDLTANSGDRITVWGSPIQTVGTTICSELQTGVIPAALAAPTPTPPPTECGFAVYKYGGGYSETDVILQGADAAAECSALFPKLPAANWTLVMGKLYGSYTMCKGTVGSSSIEVFDTQFTEPPVWTTDLCSEIAAGTLGFVPGASLE